MTTHTQRDGGLFSIGALSRATGVPADTLRTWERRYGFPEPERLASGHRRYSTTTLERLRLVTQAIGLGMRPSAVLPVSADELRALIGQAKSRAGETVGRTLSDDESNAIYAVLWQQWLEHVVNFEGRSFDRQLRVAWGQLGGMRFLTELLGPFLCELGARWERGELGVRHEHFASERLREFLAAQWRPPSDAATGPTCVCATLAGEEHVLGLHMAAVVLSMCNLRIVFLGANVPALEIANAVKQHGAQAVLLSAAASAPSRSYTKDAALLRAALPDSMPIVVGGSGFASPPPEVRKLETFEALEIWARELRVRYEQVLSK